MNPRTYENREIYSEPLCSCRLCGSENISTAFHITSYKAPFRIDRCGDCGFMFMNPPFNEDRVRDLYTREYYTGSADYSYCDERESAVFSRYVWDSRIAKIRKFAPSGNFLDLGCSFGGLLERASIYYSPFGIEISPYSVEHARKLLGDSVHTGTIADHPFSHGTFSAITMIELIEHLPDPVFALEECFRLLRKGGVLVIQTANMNGMQARILGERYAYFMPGHLSYFTKENLTGALYRTGFSSTRAFIPVEFGLLPKLLKSRHGFKKWTDYRGWLRISGYHMLSKIHFRSFAATSSMVLYAVK